MSHLICFVSIYHDEILFLEYFPALFLHMIIVAAVIQSKNGHSHHERSSCRPKIVVSARFKKQKWVILLFGFFPPLYFHFLQLPDVHHSQFSFRRNKEIESKSIRIDVSAQPSVVLIVFLSSVAFFPHFYPSLLLVSWIDFLGF